jgi:hypothetical protein
MEQGVEVSFSLVRYNNPSIVDKKVSSPKDFLLAFFEFSLRTFYMENMGTLIRSWYSQTKQIL